eukprot:scaffold184146_cov22-Prasinocladus_malaysianus.AAC.2
MDGKITCKFYPGMPRLDDMPTIANIDFRMADKRHQSCYIESIGSYSLHRCFEVDFKSPSEMISEMDRSVEWTS